LKLAETLLGPNGGEEHFRTAVNRAYYSAYLTGLLKLRSSWALSDAKSETESVHEQLRKAFVKLGQPRISDKLAELFRQRVIADYYPDENMEYSVAKNNVTLGGYIVDLIEADP